MGVPSLARARIEASVFADRVRVTPFADNCGRVGRAVVFRSGWRYTGPALNLI